LEYNSKSENIAKLYKFWNSVGTIPYRYCGAVGLLINWGTPNKIWPNKNIVFIPCTATTNLFDRMDLSLPEKKSATQNLRYNAANIQ